MKLPATVALSIMLAACASSPSPAPTYQSAPRFESFTPARSAYRIGPGDQLEITMHAVPELSRTLTVGPDGRIFMPLVSPIMVADLTVQQAQQAVMQSMSGAVVDPRLDVSVSNYAPQEIFVGGEVGAPGVQTLPGQIDPLQAIIMAGGFTDEAAMKQVLLLRRHPNGEVQSYSFDVKAGIYNPQLAKFGPLQRFDVIYVPKSRIAQHNLFLRQYVFDALPINFGLYYDLGNRQNF